MMKTCIIYIFCIVVFAIAAAGSALAEEPLTVYFVDVGQGDATLLHQPGSCTLLVDAGGADAGDAVLQAIREAGVNDLNYVVITHPHPDHFGGLGKIADRYMVKELSDNGDDAPSEKGFRAYSRLRAELPYSVVAAGDKWRCGKLDVEILHPSPDYDSGNDYNSRSLALAVKYNSFRILFLGDVGGEGEKMLLKSSANLQARVVQLGHHGAADSGSRPLLTRIGARVAIISVDASNNNIGAPAQQTLARLQAENIRFFRTDREGTIRLRVDADGSMRIKP